MRTIWLYLYIIMFREVAAAYPRMTAVENCNGVISQIAVVTTSTGRSLWKVVDNRLSHRDEVISIGDISDIVSLGEMLWIAYGAEIQCVRPYETNPIGMVLYLSSGSTPVRCAVHFPYIYALTDEALTVFDIAHGTRRILPFMRRSKHYRRRSGGKRTDFGSM